MIPIKSVTFREHLTLPVERGHKLWDYLDPDERPCKENGWSLVDDGAGRICVIDSAGKVVAYSYASNVKTVCPLNMMLAAPEAPTVQTAKPPKGKRQEQPAS